MPNKHINISILRVHTKAALITRVEHFTFFTEIDFKVCAVRAQTVQKPRKQLCNDLFSLHTRMQRA